MFMAAFTSRLSTELQPLQVHSRSFNCNSLLILPQQEEVFDDGSKREPQTGRNEMLKESN